MGAIPLRPPTGAPIPSMMPVVPGGMEVVPDLKRVTPLPPRTVVVSTPTMADDERLREQFSPCPSWREPLPSERKP